MALSGRILGAFNGSIANTAYSRPVIEWSATQNISGNYSTVTASLVFERYHGTYNRSYNNSGHSVTLTINGNKSTASRTFNIRDNTRNVVWTRTVRVNHNSDGKKSFSLSASGNTGVSLGSYNFSGTGELTQIPRASTLSAFSFGAHLKNGVANSINYTVDRKSGNFRHQIQLRDGNTTLWTWDNQNTDGSNSIPLTASNVNTLLNRMSNSTTRSLTLRVRTRSGSGGSWIGSAVTRNATATVHTDVKPTVGAVSLSQTGNSVSSHYLQGRSKVEAKFTRSAGYGASITSSSIQVRRVSGGADSQTINSNDGTTKNPVSLNGSYQARGTATDSRGRTTNTAWATFTVTAYSAPRITNFSAVRSSSAETTVSISRAGTHTHLGGSNVLTYTVQRRIGTGAWTNVNTNASGTSTTASFSGTSTSTGNSVTTSYDFRMVITDKFGESATATVTVSTQRVVLDIHKNEGVGIGKIHEQGDLDIDGSVYLSGRIEMQDMGKLNGSMYISPIFGTNGYRGLYFRPYSETGLTYRIAQHASQGQIDHLFVGEYGNDKNSIKFDKGGKTPKIGDDYVVDSDTNTNGRWVKFYDGTLICTVTDLRVERSSSLELSGTWTLPHKFADANYTLSGFKGSAAPNEYRGYGLNYNKPSTTSVGIYLSLSNGINARSGWNTTLRLTAIGRWK